MIVGTIKVPAKPKEEEKSSGQPQTDEGIVKGGNDQAFKIAVPANNKYVAHDRFSISGIAPEGATVKVDVRYFGYRSKSPITIGNFGPIFYPGVDKNTTTVNDGVWATYTVRSKRLPGMTESGYWASDEIEFIKKIDGYSCWANTYTITASLVNENGKLVKDSSHHFESLFKAENRSRHEWLNYFFYNGNCLCHPCSMIRKECYDRVGEFNPLLGATPDLDYWIRLCGYYDIYILPEKLIQCRVRNQRANRSGFNPEDLRRSTHDMYRNLMD